jgi:hypothetical protein
MGEGAVVKLFFPRSLGWQIRAEFWPWGYFQNEKTTVGVYVGRVARRDCDHRYTDRATPAGGAVGARSSPTSAVRKQSKTDWDRAAQLPQQPWNVSQGHV